MIDVTYLIQQWISCSNDIWLRWFASNKSGAHEFRNIELALLNAMVLERGGLLCKGLSIENFYQRLFVIYPNSINNQTKQLCVVQKSGNIFCKPQTISISSGSKFPVASIDSMGTMETGQPYVEIKFDNGYILESPDSVNFVIE